MLVNRCKNDGDTSCVFLLMQPSAIEI